MTAGHVSAEGRFHAGFVDCHSHVVPSGDDGAVTVLEGLALCREAWRRGTRILYATPHVAPSHQYPMTPERRELFDLSFAKMQPNVQLELRAGFELTPSPKLLDEDPHQYTLEGTDLVLVHTSPDEPLARVVSFGEHIEAAGLIPLIAHPEYSWEVLRSPSLIRTLAERGWLVQVSAASFVAPATQVTAGTAWTLLLDGVATVVASDGHRWRRPPFLDVAHALARRALGDRADALFDGSALRLAR